MTKWFGDCTPGIDSNLKFGPGTQTRQLQLCESAPWFRWKATIATANAAGAGTNGQVEMQLRCGAFNATAAHVPLKCSRLLGGCFQRCGPGSGDARVLSLQRQPQGAVNVANRLLQGSSASQWLVG